MTEQTPTGWPYPVGTDRVMDGDDAIQALASMLETRLGGGVCSGMATMPTPAAHNTPVTLQVNFPAGRFTAPPHVVATSVATDPANNAVGVNTITADGFVMTLTRIGGPLFEVDIEWMAHQPPAAEAAPPVKEGTPDE